MTDKKRIARKKPPTRSRPTIGKREQRKPLSEMTLEELVVEAHRRWDTPPTGALTSIRFPYYRNIELDSKLEFKFPLTVFTGPNGCGKSSVLQALYGAPEGKSVGRYWFSTDVDPISDTLDGKRPTFVYEYIARKGEVLQPVKTRIKKKFSDKLLVELGRQDSTDDELILDPNYWEPSRPLSWAGMVPRDTRDPSVKRKVVYLHFRTQLSAFESAFYGNGRPTTARREYLRRKSRHLKSALEGGAAHNPRGVKQSKRPREVSGQAIAEVNQIVGKEYVKATIVEHKLFGYYWAESVRFELADATYSDAFAGSGESAILRLVVALQRCATGALIVLDEPEISLHPEAQREMLRLLLIYAVKKNLQIFMATHSSHFLSGLPEEAIFVFQRCPSGRFAARNCPPDLAMFSIGHKMHRKTIVVEDRLAKSLVEQVLRGIDPGVAHLADVVVVPGGATSVLTALAMDPTGKLRIVLDGDKRPTRAALTHLEQLLDRTVVSREELDDAIDEATCQQRPSTYPQSGDGAGHARQDDAVQARRTFAKSLLERVSYIPGQGHPEELVASKASLRAICSPLGVTKEVCAGLAGDGKARAYSAAKLAHMPYESFLDSLVTRWANKKGRGYARLEATLRSIVFDAKD